MKNICLIAVFLAFALPVIAKTDSIKQDRKFRHELAIGFRRLQLPGADPLSNYVYDIAPEYNFSYANKFGLKVRLLNWWNGAPWEWGELGPFGLNDGQLYKRAYIFWDISPFYTFKLKRHRLNAGLGFTNRKGREYFAPLDYDAGKLLLVDDRGIIGEVGYSYDIGNYFIAGADFAYRAYNRGDPVITAGVKLGIVLRH